MTRPYDPNLAALDEIEDLLEAYADARLSPRGPVLARMKNVMLAQAAASAAAQRRLADLPVSRPSPWARPRPQLHRRAFALGMAAALTLGTSAAVMAAPPGSVFFNARIVLETALLPGQADARLASREQHLDQRLAEAEAAAERGDVVALEAALAAYRTEVEASIDELGNDPAKADLERLAHLESVLAKHVAVLQALEAKVPEQASIDRAIVSSQKAVQRIKDKAKEKANQGGPPPAKPGRP